MTDKITFSPVQSGTESVLQLNDNFEKIRKALNEDVLYRNNPLGTPNDIKQDIDFNLRNILNAREIDAKFIKIDGVDATDSLKNDLEAINLLVTQAETAESNASDSATAAATSEANAATSETNAATSASNAATSETNAATSETNAATSATNAATSETNAATSETNAATSESNAAQSAADAAATLDEFQGIYYGALASDPSVDPNGNAPNEGDVYYNTTDKNLRYFNGTSWSSDVDALQATQQQAEDGTDNTTYMSPLRVSEHRKFREDLKERIERDSTLILGFAENRYRIYEGLTDGHTLKPFNSTVTFSRLSNAKGFSALRVLDNALDDQQRLVTDPATGEALGLLVEGSATNSLLHNRNLADAVWTGTATIAQDAVGLDGVANTAHTLTDSSTTTVQGRDQSISIANDSAKHSVAVWYRKNSGDEANGFPALQVNLSGGTTLRQIVQIDTRDGTIAPAPSANDGSFEVEDAGDFWKLKITITNNGTGNTSLTYFAYPAHTDVLGNDFNFNATGTVVYDYGQVILNSTTVGSPILTTTAAATRAADVVSQDDVGSWLNVSNFANTFVFETSPTFPDTQNLIVFSVVSPTTNAGTSIDCIRLRKDSSGQFTARVDTPSGTSSSSTTLGYYTPGSLYRFVVVVDESGIQLFEGGNSFSKGLADFSILPDFDTLRFGDRDNTTPQISSIVKALPYALTEAEAIEESKL